MSRCSTLLWTTYVPLRSASRDHPLTAVSQVIKWTMKRFNVSRIFFGFDEMHGFNRDSRSRKLNKTNAQGLATAMNALQASMTTHNPEARAMFWGDML